MFCPYHDVDAHFTKSGAWLKEAASRVLWPLDLRACGSSLSGVSFLQYRCSSLGEHPKASCCHQLGLRACTPDRRSSADCRSRGISCNNVVDIPSVIMHVHLWMNGTRNAMTSSRRGSRLTSLISLVTLPPSSLPTTRPIFLPPVGISAATTWSSDAFH